MAATEQGRAHVITDGLVGEEQKMMPLLGFLAKSRREAEFPTEILLSPGWGFSWCWAGLLAWCLLMNILGDVPC